MGLIFLSLEVEFCSAVHFPAIHELALFLDCSHTASRSPSQMLSRSRESYIVEGEGVGKESCLLLWYNVLLLHRSHLLLIAM